jgi:hypothetical protein
MTLDIVVSRWGPPDRERGINLNFQSRHPTILANASGCYGAALTDQKQPQLQVQACRSLEADDDDQRFKERVGKLVKHKAVESRNSEASRGSTIVYT